jgi:presenilin-like A22 family membrane protease
MNKIAFFVSIFLFATAIGLYIGVRAIPQVGDTNALTGQSVDDPGGALYFLGVVLVGTIILLLILRYYKGNLLFRLFEVYIIFVGSMVVWDFAVYDGLVLGGLISSSIAYNLLVLALASLTVAIRFLKRTFAIRNITLALAIAGAGGLLGSFMGFVPALILVLALGTYDIIAVFKTKHMLKLADGSRLRELPVMFETASRGIKTGPRKGSKKGEDVIGLGTGDIAIPLIFFVGILRSFQDWFLVGAAVLGAMVGLGLTIYYVTNVKRVALPALPPIIGCSLISLGIGFAMQTFL